MANSWRLVVNFCPLVLSTLLHLVQTENCEDEAEKIDMQMAPLIAALKTESQLQDTLVLLPKVLVTHVHSSFSYFHPSSSLSFGKKERINKEWKNYWQVFFAVLVPYWKKCEVHAMYYYYIIKGLYNFKELAVNIAAKTWCGAHIYTVNLKTSRSH